MNTPPSIGDVVKLSRDFVMQRLGKYVAAVDRVPGKVIDVTLADKIPTASVVFSNVVIRVPIKWLDKMS